MSDVLTEVRGRTGLITLSRAKALNALTLQMVRDLTATLLDWQANAAVDLVAIRGMGKEGPFGAFCAGGDIRFFHKAALEGNAQLEDFFTEEYALNHLIHRFPKPYVVFMDGIVMGGGMGISGHGAANSLRIVTERTKMAMPETGIGLFPDVGGGWFLARCPGRLGEYLALTGHVVGAADALAAGLADKALPAADLPAAWEALAQDGLAAVANLRQQVSSVVAGEASLAAERARIDSVFAQETVAGMVQALESDGSAWAGATAQVLRKRSPLMLHVVLEQIRRGRTLSLADDLRMERDLVRHCFQLRRGAASETVEGIRALAVDKDHSPRWNPPRVEDVTASMVEAFFQSPWPAHAHPLRGLGRQDQA